MVEADFFVATNGNDSWSGRLPEPNADRTDGPFASLKRARDAVREEISKGLKKDIVVLIRGGTYYLEETVVFGLQDSGGSFTITYAAYPGEKPVFSGGVKIEGWRKLEEEEEPEVWKRLPPEARGKVWVADVPAELGRFYTLYDGDKRLPRARSAGFMPEKEGTYDLLYFPKGAIRNWPNLEDVEIVIRPTNPWVVNILSLESVDETACVAKTAIPGTYPLTKLVRGPDRDSPSCWVENVIDFLDEPGEWVLNTRERRLYLWPRGDSPGDQIIAPRLRELIRVEGKIDFDGPEDTPVRNLVFKGLTFTHGDRDVWTKDDAGLQHDWEMYDKANALVRLRGAEGCVIEECHFKNSGGTAIRLDLYCQNNRITKNLIEHMGGTGILLCGYGPGTKDVNKRNEVSNNHIHHCGEIYWHSAGIFIWQSGENLIANNLIHDMPYNGIVVSGVRPSYFNTPDKRECSRTIRWKEVGDAREWQDIIPFLHARNNIIENNEIYRVMEMLADGNGIYISGAGEGNIIRRNYIHHVLGRGTNAAIRTDGWQRGTTITENIIYKCRGGITRKSLNHIENNIIVDIEEGGYIQFRSFPGEEKTYGSRIQKNIFYCSGERAVFYEARATRAVTLPKDCEADYNLFYCAGNPEWSSKYLEELRREGIEKHSISADPLFVDIENGDFRLKPDSPALKLGFKPIDISTRYYK